MSYATPRVALRWPANNGDFNDIGQRIPGTPTVVEVPGAIVAPHAEGESVGRGRSAVIDGLDIYLPPGTPVDARCQVIIGDNVYEVDGEPEYWGSPYTGIDRGIRIQAKRVHG